MTAPAAPEERRRGLLPAGATWLLAAVATLVLAGVNLWLQPSFFEPGIVASNLTTFLPLILVAIGQTWVVLASDIDLSIGSIVSLANVVTVTVVDALGADGTAIAAGLAAGLATGVACGLVNGFCVAALRFQPIVTTFATGVVFAGLALMVLPQAGLPVPEAYWRGYAGGLFGVRTVVLVLAAAVLLCLLIEGTRFARALRASGGQMQAAYQSGVPVAWTRVRAYMLAGFFAALAALCLTGETASGDPLLGGAYALSSISAVVLGGTALAGGVGGFLGSIFGAVVLGLIGNVIFFARLPFEYQTLVQGLIVLAALAGGVLVARR